ncbi:MAG: N-acetyl-gamma-glutamyl-phosphate reductase [Actinomycetota bacterium]|jgi:N-acetyl-gamma-glutamyl-phosphate reductase|nr:N-acetyl-gamma-glutamyl-phosphate reductase [Actinomycetota bacterium]MDA3011423.1 N-acetyl-gamma-glutamyl-phosphate reductase [Actinomycetota bacterium]MDA3024998.1 N-acetyl-gamma-glutamyl-phosphate reductase [Actinomycetota bacterium]
MSQRTHSVAILGASGYTGAELLRLVAHHPTFELVVATGDTQAGAPVSSLYPSLAARYRDLVFAPNDPSACDGADIVFLGLPHEASLEIVPQLQGKVGCIVDLSAAFRLKDASAYPEYYGFAHDRPDLLSTAVYGLPERHRDSLAGATLVATPGCYVTAATLAVAPLVDAGLIDTSSVIVDAASGVSGAGRAPKHTNLFCTVDEDVNAYGLLNHRHTPEMQEQIGATVLFTPHLVPMNRGILATCYARPSAGTSVSTPVVMDALLSAYANEPFVVVRDEPPSTKATLGSNAVHLTARYDERTGTVVVISALDNLCKGASGGAVQAANVALGIDETSGLTAVGVYP